MLHEKIDKQPRKIVRKDRAIYAFSKSRLSNKRRRWQHLYRIYPPANKPFLPSDESIRELVATIPGIHFLRSRRFAHKDYFTVYGANKNIFTSQANSSERAVRRAFLKDVEYMALETRSIPKHVQDACEIFLSTCGFVHVTWNGVQAIAYTADNMRYEGNGVTGGNFRRPFRDFEHICQPILPFYYEAAPP